MSANVVKLQLVTVGENFRFEPDALLEAAKGQGFTNLLIIGEMSDGDDLYVASSGNVGEALIAMELAKLQIIRRD